MANIIKVLTESTGSIESLQALLSRARDYQPKAITLFCADGNGYTPDSLNPILQTLDLPVFGGIFPQLLDENRHLEQGNIAILWDAPITYVATKKISGGDSPLTPAIPDIQDTPLGDGFLMLLIDGLSQNIELFLDKLYLEIGGECEVVGGGAGSLSLKQSPCIITNEGLMEDCALLAWIPSAIGIGICHGWKPVAGPFVATTSERNEVHSLNYKPAFQVYSEAIHDSCQASFEGKDFFEVAKTYPLGIQNLDSQVTVRDPIIEQDDALVCVGNVPNFSKVYILKGEPETLVQAAGRATALSLKGLTEKTPSARPFSFVFNCISRALFLEEGFGKELDEIVRTLPSAGAYTGLLTLGEIATSELGSLQLHNKSVVVASMGGAS